MLKIISNIRLVIFVSFFILAGLTTETQGEMVRNEAVSVKIIHTNDHHTLTLIAIRMIWC